MAEHKAMAEVQSAIEDILCDRADWLVISHADSTAFIQFALGFFRRGECDGERIIIMDLPCKALTPDQAERAAKEFRQSQWEGPVEEKSEGVVDNNAHWLATWKEDFERDSPKAARAALERLQRIYQLPDGFDVVLQAGRAD